MIPKPKLLSQRLGVSEREIVDMDQRLDGWDISLDAPLKEDSDTERIEFMSTESESAEETVAKKEMSSLLNQKNCRIQDPDDRTGIGDLRQTDFFRHAGYPSGDWSMKYGISRERVRLVEKNVVKKMRDYFKKEIPDFETYTEGVS